MDRVYFKSNITEESREYAELVEIVLLIINRISVELTLESKCNKTVTADQFRVAVMLIHSACGVGTLVPDLIKEKSLRLPYAFPLARMYYERLLSAAYILSDNGNSARRAILYSVYRAFKGQTKLFSPGGFINVIQDKKRISRKSPIVIEALEYFKTASRIEEYEHSRRERCDIIGKRSKKAVIHFVGVEQAGHSVSSEVMHGSYFSTVLFSEIPSDDTPEKSFDEATTLIMMILILSSEAPGHLLVEVFPQLPSPPLLIESGKTFMKLEVPEAIDRINRAYEKKP